MRKIRARHPIRCRAAIGGMLMILAAASESSVLVEDISMVRADNGNHPSDETSTLFDCSEQIFAVAVVKFDGGDEAGDDLIIGAYQGGGDVEQVGTEKYTSYAEGEVFGIGSMEGVADSQTGPEGAAAGKAQQASLTFSWYRPDKVRIKKIQNDVAGSPGDRVKSWAWLKLHRPPGGGVMSLVDPTYGFAEAIGTWELVVETQRGERLSTTFDVEC